MEHKPLKLYLIHIVEPFENEEGRRLSKAISTLGASDDDIKSALDGYMKELEQHKRVGSDNMDITWKEQMAIKDKWFEAFR